MCEVNSGRELASEVSCQLRGLGLDVRTTDEAEAADLVVTVPTASGPVEFGIEVVNSDAPITVPRLTRIRSEHRPVIVAQRHITPGIGDRYRSWDLPYVDSGGNMWLTLPGYTVRIEGRKPVLRSSPGLDRTSRAFNPAGLRVIFVLLTKPEHIDAPLRELSAAAEVSLGATQMALADLQSQGLVHHARSGHRLVTNTRRLGDEWLAHYAARLKPKLRELQLTGPVPEWWLGNLPLPATLSVAVGGEAAMAALGYQLRPSTTLLYGRSPWGAVRKFGRLREGGDPNVLLRQRFWSESLFPSDQVVPSLLVYADAMASSDPRQSEVATQMWEDDEELRRLAHRG